MGLIFRELSCNAVCKIFLQLSMKSAKEQCVSCFCVIIGLAQPFWTLGPLNLLLIVRYCMSEKCVKILTHFGRHAALASSSEHLAYTPVLLKLLWPTNFCTSSSFAPLRSARLMQVCRRQCGLCLDCGSPILSVRSRTSLYSIPRLMPKSRTVRVVASPDRYGASSSSSSAVSGW